MAAQWRPQLRWLHPPVLCCKDLVDFAASGFLALGQEALLLAKAGLTPPSSGSVAQLAAREAPARWPLVARRAMFLPLCGSFGLLDKLCRGPVFTPPLTPDATAGSSTSMGCKGCALTLPRAKTAARRLPGGAGSVGTLPCSLALPDAPGSGTGHARSGGSSSSRRTRLTRSK
jgi:hypothetical protein